MTRPKFAESLLCPQNQNHRQQSKLMRNRKGGVVVLMAVLLPVIFVLASFTINIAYLQLTRTELLVATDASARAAGRAWSYYQNVDDAKNSARVTAALNNVAGAPLLISFNDSTDDIEFGDNNISETSNRFEFTKVQTAAVKNQTDEATSVRINGKLNDTSLNGSLIPLFPAMGLKEPFQLHQTATATQLDRDIALILDRSGSMGWIEFDWPYGVDPWSQAAKDAAVAGGVLELYWYRSRGRWRQGYRYTEGNDQTSYYQYVWEHHYNLGPAPQRPWDELVGAVDTFLNVLDNTDQEEQVSLATYSHYATLDHNLVKDFDVIRDHLESVDPDGSTAIGYGLQTGLPSLLNTNYVRPFAAKTIIIMTDGIHNYGTDPVVVAQQVVDQYNFTIHTVTFGSNADISRMQQIAEIGGGKHYHAETGQELDSVFEELANNLPTLITQ